MININRIADSLKVYVQESSHNLVKELDNMTIYDEPIIGVASAKDPLFLKLKDIDAIGPHHMTPREWLPNAKSVISYFLPFSLKVRSTNRMDDNLPSTEWLYGRIEGEKFNNKVRSFLHAKLIDMNAMALVPDHDSRYKSIDRRSNWSERHVAYISGLGTFSLAKNLITEKGCAGRFGSIVTDLEINPTQRAYEEIYEYCNDCGACIKRCPASAITKDGKEHDPCDIFLTDIKEQFSPRYGCGKCQTAVPCEYRIPNKTQK